MCYFGFIYIQGSAILIHSISRSSVEGNHDEIFYKDGDYIILDRIFVYYTSYDFTRTTIIAMSSQAWMTRK